MSFDSRTLRRQFPLLAGQPALHYLDNAATAQPLHAAFGVEASARASLALYNGDEDIDALLAGLEAARRTLR